MSKDKQIDEMARIIDDNLGFIVSSVETAEALYNKGYRKASEIFEEIESLIDNKFSIYHGVVLISKEDFAELKKKYTEGVG